MNANESCGVKVKSCRPSFRSQVYNTKSRRLVKHFARKFATAACPKEDLEQEGYLTLLKISRKLTYNEAELWTISRRSVLTMMLRLRFKAQRSLPAEVSIVESVQDPGPSQEERAEAVCFVERCEESLSPGDAFMLREALTGNISIASGGKQRAANWRRFKKICDRVADLRGDVEPLATAESVT